MAQSPRESLRTDVAVIGGGTAGLTAALAARHEGAEVVLVEREARLGGDCTFTGCVPSKTLVEIARTVHAARRAAADGILRSAPEVDFARVQARRERTVAAIAEDESDERCTSRGIRVLHGRARFAGAHELALDEGPLVRAQRVVLATGSEPAVPAGLGLEGVPYLTNETVFGLERLPRRLLVAGAGPTGLELGQAFMRLGSEVAIVEAAPRLLPGLEPELGDVVARALEHEGIELRLGEEVLRAAPADGGVSLHLSGGELRGDALLVALGRRATVEGLGLEAIGVELRDGFVAADDRCRTSVAHVFACGDVTGGLFFTHVAAHEGRVAGLNAAGARASVDHRVVPQVVYVDPEVASVGLTEADALASRSGVRTATFPLARVDRARIAGEVGGLVKLVTAARRLVGRIGEGELVGAHLAGPAAGELVHECVLAMQTRCFAGRLAQAIHAYPSHSLALQQAGAQLYPLGRVLAPAADPA